MSFVMEKSALGSLINALRKRGYESYGPVRKGPEFVFTNIKQASDLALDYVTTIISPKKYLYAPSEKLFSFNSDGFNIKESSDGTGKQALLAVHPCDLSAIALLDKVRTSGAAFEDPKYKEKRNNTILVGLNCSKAGEECFCTSFGTGPDAKQGFDLLLTDLGDRYLVDTGTDAGKAVVADLRLKKATASDAQEKERKAKAVRQSIKRGISTDGLPKALDKNFNHEIWGKMKDDCYSCGTCTTVCPTCYCFNVVDNVDFSLKNGERVRNWDSCQLIDFGQVALGGNFRKDRDARVKQWIYHKLNYFPQQYGGNYACVGCGRCIKNCTKGIDMTNIVKTLQTA
jgi:ferredoxin